MDICYIFQLSNWRILPDRYVVWSSTLHLTSSSCCGWQWRSEAAGTELKQYNWSSDKKRLLFWFWGPNFQKKFFILTLSNSSWLTPNQSTHVLCLLTTVCTRQTMYKTLPSSEKCMAPFETKLLKRNVKFPLSRARHIYQFCDAPISVFFSRFPVLCYFVCYMDARCQLQDGKIEL